MGEDIAATVFSREDRQRYRQKVRTCLDVFARMLREARFDPERRSMGLEIELNLIDDAGDPALRNATVLEAIADNDFPTELGQFNVEINIPPQLLAGDVFTGLEQQLRDSLNRAEDKSRGVGAHMMIGILPTISDTHLNAEALTANPRYKLLNEQIFAARGEDLQISIAGQERLRTFADTIAPEAACTSVQFHLQVGPERFATVLERRAGHRRRADRGRRELAVLLRPGAMAGDADRAVRPGHRHAPGGAQGPGRAPAGVVRRALDHLVFDLFEENVTYFPALLPVCERRTRSRCSRPAACPRWPSCACTTARSTAGTARSTTSSAASRTCGSRTACSLPARRWSTCWPTPPSTTGWSGR